MITVTQSKSKKNRQWSGEQQTGYTRAGKIKTVNLAIVNQLETMEMDKRFSIDKHIAQIIHVEQGVHRHTVKNIM